MPLAVTAVTALAVLGLAPAAHADPGDEISMPDDVLRECVNTALSQNPADPITEGQAAGLTIVNCQNGAVTDLSGMEHMTSLQQAHLGNNPVVTDLASLEGLDRLWSVAISGTGVDESDLESLETLPALEYLVVSSNGLTDVSSLEIGRAHV